MENKPATTAPQDDVLHFEHHNALSSEEIAKAVQRHNREHKGDAPKAVQATVARGKKR